ncbi:MAG: L,D-transpeptidase family protein [Verrucomicrobiae bacterium]|nr:L,D-transpeptidase family protein [Verrucomicrobiae bacterium]NNJ86914.1 L,D-transpeptidase family protein [Akkermansiaceae bacterium]
MAEGTPVYQPKGYWDGDGVVGPAKIRIVRSEQKAYFYKGGTLVGVSPISSGDAEHTTPAGRFRITQKNIDHKSSLYGVIKNIATGEVVNKNADTRIHKAGPGEIFVNAPMPYFMRFNAGIGMHTGFLPGYPASHGCVRMPDKMARKFFENAKLGTPVIVE